MGEGRSQRDELERLQQEPREVRLRWEALPREHAELSAQVEQLEQEVRSLRERVKQARAEALLRPSSFLPRHSVLPYSVPLARRTLLDRLLLTLQAVPPGLVWLLFGGALVLRSLWFSALFFTVCLCAVAPVYPHRRLEPGPKGEEEALAWSFDEEGFGPEGLPGWSSYSRVQSVEVLQGWLQRLLGRGTVRIIWHPSVPTDVGRVLDYPYRVVELQTREAPQRLAEWLRERVRARKEAQDGG